MPKLLHIAMVFTLIHACACRRYDASSQGKIDTTAVTSNSIFVMISTLPAQNKQVTLQTQSPNLPNQSSNTQVDNSQNGLIAFSAPSDVTSLSICTPNRTDGIDCQNSFQFHAVEKLATKNNRVIFGITASNFGVSLPVSIYTSAVYSGSFSSRKELVVISDRNSSVSGSENSKGNNSDVDPNANSSAGSDIEREVVRIVNEERRAQGLGALTIDENLMQACRAWSQTQASQGSMYHGNAPVAENVAMGTSSPTGVMQMWMNSTGHRNNILGAGFRYIGVGLVNGYWTQQFR